MPIAPLVASNDADLTGWQSGTQATFLDMACAEVRKFCGWHIAPSNPETSKRCWFGANGLIMLGSTFVTAVDRVTVDGQVLEEDSDYWWDEPKGWLRHRHLWPHDHFALVDFTHGYDEPPPDVKAVIFEVVATAMELPASNATEVMTEQYRFNLKTAVGVALSEDQKTRLGQYRIRKFGGLTRP
jgi:hypothetical protein